jgi:hypothetical protein
LEKKAEQVLVRRREEVVQAMYTYINKCKIKERK